MSIGLLYAFLSAFFNGTFGTLGKIRPVRDAQVPPHIFNFWTCMGLVLSSLPLLATSSLTFTWYGLISGLLFVLSCGASMAAIQFLGLSIASGVWCGTAVLTSFSYGVLVKGDTLAIPSMAALSLLLLLIGIVGVAISGRYAHEVDQSEEGAGEWHPLDDESSRPKISMMTGAFVAVFAGLCGGLILAPMTRAPKSVQGLPFVPSMVAGVLLASPIVTGIAAKLMGMWPPRLQWNVAAGPGVVAGILWNLGNMCSIMAVQDPAVGLAVAYPIMQCGLFVAGAWGVLLFKEMEGVHSAVNLLYWYSGVLILTGACLLYYSK